jgi:hypothetical protein
MKATLLQTAVQNSAKRIPMGLVVAAAVTFLHQNATAITTIDYGAASSFAILAGTGISDAGGSSITGTALTGNVGLSPTTGFAITGLTHGQVGGTIYTVDGLAPTLNTSDAGLLTTAKNAFGAANTAAAGQSPTPPNLGLQLGTQTLLPGVYTFDPGTVLLDGTLTLNGNGEAHPIWIFQAKSDLTTGSSSGIVFENGGIPCDVLWEVPTQATLGTDSTFVGTIMAGTSIVMDHGATLDGRAWAEAAVTLDDNIITGLPCTSLTDTGGTGGTTVPDTGSTLPLLGIGVLGLLALSRARGQSLVLTQNRRAIS